MNKKNLFLYSFVLATFICYLLVAGATPRWAHFLHRTIFDIVLDILVLLFVWAAVFLFVILIDFLIKKSRAKVIIFWMIAVLFCAFPFYSLRYELIVSLPRILKEELFDTYLRLKLFIYSTFLESRTENVQLFLKVLAIIIIGGAFLYLTYILSKKYRKGFLTVNVVLCCVLLLNLFYYNDRFKTTSLDTSLYSAKIYPLEKKEGELPKTVHIILFDAFAYTEDIFSKGEADIEKYKNFSKLLSQSYVFHKAESPGDNTATSIPKMFTKKDGDVVYSYSKSYIENENERISLYDTPNIFSLAREYNDSVYITGNFHTYCYDFKDWVSDCNDYPAYASFYSLAQKNFIEKIYNRFRIIKASWMPFLGMFGIEDEELFYKVPSLYKIGREHIDTYLWGAQFKSIVFDYQKFMRENNKNALFFTHLNLPHDPYSFNAKGETVADEPVYMESYPAWNKELFLEQAQYMDKVLGILLEDIENTADYDKSLIIITADHSAKNLSTVFPDTRHIPLIVKTPFQKKRKDIDEEYSTLYLMDIVKNYYESRDSGKKVDWF
ncbi:sulfatase-like hydrolase/transferase [Patescibacteria group bacterium]|nr:sulfatase-like hydrolase/transferase [Patescibacteria group bacterium]